MIFKVKRVAIRRVHSWIRYMMLQQMNYVNHDGIISGMPLMRTRFVIGPTLQYMPNPGTFTKKALYIMRYQ